MELQLWREMLTPYELAVDELVLKFRHIIREYRNVGRYSPIEQVDGRVKSISSILDKMQRKKINVNDVEKELEDIAGIRLICQFVEDIDRVLEIIESRSDMEIKSHKDYISHSKDSGYRSYHDDPSLQIQPLVVYVTSDNGTVQTESVCGQILPDLVLHPPYILVS